MDDFKIIFRKGEISDSFDFTLKAKTYEDAKIDAEKLAIRYNWSIIHIYYEG